MESGCKAESNGTRAVNETYPDAVSGCQISALRPSWSDVENNDMVVFSTTRAGIEFVSVSTVTTATQGGTPSPGSVNTAAKEADPLESAPSCGKVLEAL
jgi:hypothetical protein